MFCWRLRCLTERFRAPEKYILRALVHKLKKPPTDAAWELAELPVRRPIERNIHSRGNSTTRKSQNVPAAMVQLVGLEAPSSCSRCADRRGPWSACVVAPASPSKITSGACANCHYNPQGSRRSSHSKNLATSAPASTSAAPETEPATGKGSPLTSAGFDIEQLESEHWAMSAPQPARAEAEIQWRMSAMVLARLRQEKESAAAIDVDSDDDDDDFYSVASREP
ncbi:hypothetical protein CMEL01_16730 [Colletotrichum melonis]|uniref:Uncharacterized protein n=1 Tax=Colletotrichum melonis TaxID=1209925 RepID=A0AAI9UEB9_9PEZI|nr:hypothetical protein CMEL01_16730 [Colletotrichum melonis]